MTISTCLACGGAGSLVHAFTAKDRSLKAVEGEFSFSRCSACGSVNQVPQPDDETLSRAYAADYGNYQSEPSLVERLGAPLARREASRLRKSADPTQRLVELGAGTGRFLERLRDVGWSGPLEGVEYDERTAASTAARLGIRCDVGTVEDAEFEPGSVGTIVLRHVIEHLREPRAELARLREALQPGGLIYVATPDAAALSASVFGDRWWGYEVPRHLVVFSSDALARSLSDQGFELVDRWWNWSPQMWAGSLGLALDGRKRSGWWSSMANPVTMPAFGLAAAAEVASRRSTMLSVVARRR